MRKETKFQRPRTLHRWVLAKGQGPMGPRFLCHLGNLNSRSFEDFTSLSQMFPENRNRTQIFKFSRGGEIPLLPLSCPISCYGLLFLNFVVPRLITLSSNTTRLNIVLYTFHILQTQVLVEETTTVCTDTTFA